MRVEARDRVKWKHYLSSVAAYVPTGKRVTMMTVIIMMIMTIMMMTTTTITMMLEGAPLSEYVVPSIIHTSRLKGIFPKTLHHSGIRLHKFLAFETSPTSPSDTRLTTNKKIIYLIKMKCSRRHTNEHIDGIFDQRM